MPTTHGASIERRFAISVAECNFVNHHIGEMIDPNGPAQPHCVLWLWFDRVHDAGGADGARTEKSEVTLVCADVSEDHPRSEKSAQKRVLLWFVDAKRAGEHHRRFPQVEVYAASSNRVGAMTSRENLAENGIPPDKLVSQHSSSAGTWVELELTRFR